ncbi:MAG TPA: CaiB/BaiF CoA-transferase family protein [Smithellaceae bacterium]|jgi:crotonobetainyl-CoA:carnitine CoA-transferase CaiB-like acyl-CoA transferase|nr:CoA transferase [Syntrophaceae bacterium]NMC90088.1 CoA transferase [Smithella sp.]HNV57070.1 CaiB/BaiF CoA-transferase family protein [Smithellaceae bacterium]MBP9532668.1 CoA transferase [Syntrophaceae bacterium]HNY96897.1 CaiB/BaiF CoA-transferase family protein [Smithellaceae bacterium]
MAGPLEGLKVLDFTTLLPGPYATMILSDLGADVLKVTSGSRPDLAAIVPPFIGKTDLTAASAYLGRGKRSITLNLKDARGLQVVHRLLERYDVLIEQFRPGIMAKLGLGFDDLAPRYPSLIYCSLTGYGQTGPMKDRAGHDINYLSLSGLMGYAGRKYEGPVPMPLQIADVASGSNNAVIAILAAVFSRSRSGKGQYLDISMTDGAFAFNALAAAAYLVSGEEPTREGFILNGGSLYDFYKTADGHYLSFGGLEPQFFAAFCNAIGRPDWIAGGVAPPDCAGVKEEVRKIIKSKTRGEWKEIFDKTDACVEPVLSLSEALDSELVRERQLTTDITLPDGSTVRQPASPFKFSATPPVYGKTGVKAGSHNREVFLELGYSEEEINEFGKTGLFS